MNRHGALLEYLADGLSDEARADFVRHLAVCSLCRHAVDDDRRGRELVTFATTPVSNLERARLVTALRTRETDVARRSLRKSTVAVAAALILVIGVMGAGRWTRGHEPPPTSASVVSELVADAAISSGSVTTRTVLVDGQAVVIAESSRPFPMPSDGSAVQTSTPDVWLVQRDGVNVVCQNGPTSRLVASSLPAAQLVDLVASGQLG
ncbi:MAG: hypothetical protein HY828_21105 [Actinobacteria bacterium]|nr:hypothetical protein [Actinomycetota bacterium]